MPDKIKYHMLTGHPPIVTEEYESDSTAMAAAAKSDEVIRVQNTKTNAHIWEAPRELLAKRQAARDEAAATPGATDRPAKGSKAAKPAQTAQAGQGDGATS